MPEWYFCSDLHGRVDRYQKLFQAILEGRPEAVFLGGDLLPSSRMVLSSLNIAHSDFINGFLAAQFRRLRDLLGESYPSVFLILGNDDARFEEAAVLDAATTGIWMYLHNRHCRFNMYTLYGYAFIPPSPFLLKDWERFDVSRYVDPGCVAPEDGRHSVPVQPDEIRHATISEDLDKLAGDGCMERAVFLFHSPPYNTCLDRADLDGRTVDHVPVDVHIGSIAIRRFIRSRQPLMTLHGHVHESARLTGYWRDRLERTWMFSAAHDGPELALVRIDPESPGSAWRELI